MKSLVPALLLLVLFSACQNQAPTTAPATNNGEAILKHKYWVSKQFNDALFAENIVDTLCNMLCSELIFTAKDSLLMTACLSDAGGGIFKVTGPNTLEITFEGMDSLKSKATYDEKTGVLHIDPPGGMDSGWPTEFVAQDGIDINQLDNVTIALGRKRLAGKYVYQTKKGEMAVASLTELYPDGKHVNFGESDLYEPWPSGIGAGFIQNPQLNLMYLIKKGKETDPVAVAWQVRGDTLKIWDTKTVGPQEDLPEYKTVGEPRVYIKQK